MSQQKEGLTLLALVDQMRDCRRKQKAFRREKNTPNYKAMLESEEATDTMPTAVRKNVVANADLNIEVLP